LESDRWSRAAQASVVGLLILASLFTIWVAKPVLLPILVAGLLAATLAPPVNALKAIGIPRAAGAAVVLAVSVAAFVYGASRVIGPATEWAADLPDLVDDARGRLEGLFQSVDAVSEAAEGVREAAQGEGTGGAQPQVVTVAEPSFGALALDRTRTFLGQALIVLAILFFLLSGGDRLLLRLIRVLPTLSARKRGVRIARRLQRDISYYLVTITCINAGLGLVVGFAMWLLGMPNAPVWGVMAAFLNFIPYLGAVASASILALVALAHFDTLVAGIVPPLVYITVNSLEGFFITPAFLGRRLRLDPLAILIALLVAGFMWGIPGLLVAVPTLGAFKVVADAFPELEDLSQVLSR
jgi:predicted PurR-regulated permease PerM